MIHKSILIFGLLILSSCTRDVYKKDPGRISDGAYDSEFPSQAASESIEDLLRSVKLLSTIAFYESFEFAEESGVAEADLSSGAFRDMVMAKYHFNQPATGTATIVYHENRKVALLTCAHIIDFPDSIISYFPDEEGKPTASIQRVAIKSRQNINIIDIQLGGNFEVLAIDETNDLAIVGKELKITTTYVIPVFKYRLGSAADLGWGSFVYIAGFPRGEKMLSRGIVSSPDRDRRHSFVIDAVFNRGFSGGLVLAIRDGIPNFELVGIAKSVPAETRFFLSPDETYRQSEMNIKQAYDGDVLVQSLENIFYGITYASSAETIQSFINRNKQPLGEKGYDVKRFFPVK